MAHDFETLIESLSTELDKQGYRKFTQEERFTHDEKDREKSCWHYAAGKPVNFEVRVSATVLKGPYENQRGCESLECKDHKQIELAFRYALPTSMVEEHRKFRDFQKALTKAGESLCPNKEMLNQFLKRQLFFSNEFEPEQRHYPCIEHPAHSWIVFKDGKENYAPKGRDVEGIHVKHTINCINHFPENIVESLVRMTDYALKTIMANYETVVISESLRK